MIRSYSQVAGRPARIVKFAIRRPKRMMKILPLVLLCAACASADLPDAPISLRVVGTSAKTAGAAANAILRNLSGHVVWVGPAECYLTFDQLTGSTWTQPPPRNDLVCIAVSYAIANGADFPFGFTVPAAAGTYRLRLPLPVEHASVLSAAFMVR